jgi:hypothetical protein
LVGITEGEKGEKRKEGEEGEQGVVIISPLLMFTLCLLNVFSFRLF